MHTGALCSVYWHVNKTAELSDQLLLSASALSHLPLSPEQHGRLPAVRSGFLPLRLLRGWPGSHCGLQLWRLRRHELGLSGVSDRFVLSKITSVLARRCHTYRKSQLLIQNTTHSERDEAWHLHLDRLRSITMRSNISLQERYKFAPRSIVLATQTSDRRWGKMRRSIQIRILSRKLRQHFPYQYADEWKQISLCFSLVVEELISLICNFYVVKRCRNNFVLYICDVIRFMPAWCY